MATPMVLVVVEVVVVVVVVVVMVAVVVVVLHNVHANFMISRGFSSWLIPVEQERL